MALASSARTASLLQPMTIMTSPNSRAVFTGLSFGNNSSFALYPRDFTVPMKCWDAFHDCSAKTLLGGLQLPVRAPSPGSNGVAGLADVNAAVSNLFAHPNVGPFIGARLIQRLVTSNPGTGYVARVSAAFADNAAACAAT